MNFNMEKVQQQFLQYFMFADKNKIPVDQFMINNHVECEKLGNTVLDMIRTGYIKKIYIDRHTNEVLYE